MNQEIDVELSVIDDTDILLFKLDPDVPVNLNKESGQQDFKKVFSRLLQLSLNQDITLRLSIASGYTKGLYKEVCDEYINALNDEISRVSAEIKRTIK